MNHEPGTLPADRERLLKEHLMNEIARDHATTAARRPRRRRGWLVAPPLVVGLAAAVALLATGHPAGDPAPTTRAGAAPLFPTSATPSTCPDGTAPTDRASAPATPAPGSAPAGVTDARQAFAAAAQAAASKPVPQVDDSQFLYSETLQRFSGEDACVRREWIALDGRTDGVIIDPHNGRMSFSPNSGGLPTGLLVPNHAYLAALPTDPQALLEQIRAQHPEGGDGDADGAAFRVISNLVSTQLLTPRTAAAFCQAAAAVPGATFDLAAVDLTGRHGIGVIRADATDRTELIFDPHSCEYLGSHSVRLVTFEGGDPVGATFDTAVLRRAVTDKAGEVPAP
ncbi:CU044_5270 family protein [Kitasatospora sp. NPDC090308]|uniref:CU044_5270 family protein n=1 Tax=Kitasatospora sp. NPDC090308 TaxID=3364082 RepID=UPI003818DB05